MYKSNVAVSRRRSKIILFRVSLVNGTFSEKFAGFAVLITEPSKLD